MSKTEPQRNGGGKKELGAEQDPKGILDTFCLVGPDGGRTPHERIWWRRGGIYLSDVCLAVQLSPDFEVLDSNQQEAAREALYTYLRRVAHTAMEHDYLRPLACVLAPTNNGPCAEMVQMLKTWTAAQDWHRGAFTLYVELPDNTDTRRTYSNDHCDCPTERPWTYEDRLADLLSPRPDELILPEIDPITIERIENSLKRALNDAQWTDPEVGRRADKLVADFGNIVEDLAPAAPKQGPRSATDALDGWANEIMSTARSAAKGARP